MESIDQGSKTLGKRYGDGKSFTLVERPVKNL